MKAIQANSYGGPETLTINASVKEPQLQEQCVLVTIHAAGINPFDIALLSGIYKDKMPLSFPVIPGGDFSGVILTTGSDIAHVSIGDEVYGSATIVSGGSGSFAQISLAKATRVAKKPKHATHEEAAALPLVGSSAVQALEEHIHLKPKQKILIHGGAGGIGHVAIQVAKALGAYVATTVSTDDMEFVKRLGADEVINYKTQHFEVLLKNFDAVYDTVGGDITTRSFLVLKKEGILVSMKAQPDQILAKQYGVTPIGQNTKINTSHLERVAQLVDEGSLNIHIERVYPMNRVQEAWEHQQSGHPRGKIVLQISI